MKAYLLCALLFLTLCACRNTEPDGFISDAPPLNMEDRIVMTELYHALNLKGNIRYPWILDRPDTWSGISFEYDETCGKRFVTGISLRREVNGPISDSIPASLGKLSRLHKLRIENFCYAKDFPIPKTIFNCHLDTLILSNSHFAGEMDVKGIAGILPGDILKLSESLKVLQITHTNLSGLSEMLRFMDNLTVCDFSHNRLNEAVPDYLSFMKCCVDVRYNYYDTFNWYLLQNEDVTMLPLVKWNYICNLVPDEMIEEYYDFIISDFLPQKNNHLQWYLKYRHDQEK